ncbi:MAG TPA: DNA translocase FtsK, partial [Thermoanaerobacterales bacterium]|nr:DNA translocase FtsK [Thermoanaerobacterales bacterium]
MKRKKKLQKSLIIYDIYGVALIAFAILSFLSIFNNSAGQVGNILDKFLKGLIGGGAYIIPFIFLLLGLYVVLHKDKLVFSYKSVGIIVIFIITIVYLHIPVQLGHTDMKYYEKLKRSIVMGAEGKGGGFAGSLISILLLKLFGNIGTKVILGASFLIGIILLFNKSLTFFPRKVYMSLNTLLKNIVKKLDQQNKTNEADSIEQVKINDDSNLKHQIQIISEPKSKEAINTGDVASKPIQEETQEIDFHGHEIGKDYILPTGSILEKTIRNENTIAEKQVLKKALVLKNTLESFGVKAKILQVSCGPTVTRYEVQPSPGVKVSRIVSLSDDIALSLAASHIRIEAPIPGKAAIGIEVPNKKTSTVYLKEIVETKEFESTKSKLTVALGKDIAGKPVVANLNEMPHLLISGATGSGKSVCLNCIISSILFKANPDEVKFVLIDPKVVELKAFDGIPHLITPVVVDPQKAASALAWVVNIMEDRYKKFAELNVRDITRYNEKSKTSLDIKHMPQIIVIIDELADLMMVAPNEVEDSICRIAQMARAAGIHLVVATQRPSVDV